MDIVIIQDYISLAMKGNLNMKKNILLILILVIALTIVSCTTTEVPENDSPQLPMETDKPQEETNDVVGEANIIHLADETYHENVDNSEGIVIVDFWAAWCGPCLQLAPILEEISAEEGITLYKVNVDECPKLSQEFQITGIPMVYIYKDGEIIGTQLGVAPKSMYMDTINNN